MDNQILIGLWQATRDASGLKLRIGDRFHVVSLQGRRVAIRTADGVESVTGVIFLNAVAEKVIPDLPAGSFASK